MMLLLAARTEVAAAVTMVVLEIAIFSPGEIFVPDEIP